MAAAAATAAVPPPAELTEREAEVYDRQIRLWGLDAQKRMRAARVLVAGLGALGAEVVKNVALAGVGVTVLDTRLVTEADTGAQFFVSAAHVGQNRAAASLAFIRELNPLMEPHALTAPLASLSDAELREFRLVVVCDAPPHEQLAAAARLRALGVAHILATSYGFRAVVMQDWISHDYTVTVAPAVVDGPSTEATHTAVFASVAATLETPLPCDSVQRYTAKRKGVLTHYVAWRGVFMAQAALGSGAPASGGEATAHLAAAARAEATRHALASGLQHEGGGAGSSSSSSSSAGGVGGKLPATVETAVVPALVDEFVRCIGVELSPVAAVVGGVVGTEVIKALSGRHAPLTPGVFMFDGMGGTGGILISLAAA